MKPRDDYFKPGVEHLCMFCSTPIARLVDGVLRPLGNKAHVLFEKKKVGLYIINCCGDCAKSTDFTDSDLLKDIHKAVKKNIKAINPSAQFDDADEPVVGFVRRELNIRERPTNVKEFKEKHAS